MRVTLPAWPVVALALLLGCPGGGDECDDGWCLEDGDCVPCATGGGGGSACVPDCAGRQCGPDGCGGTCGSCSDANACTDDACTAAGTCAFTPKADSQTCQGITLTGCTAGQAFTTDCAQLCRDHAFNYVQGCGISGSMPDRCNCAAMTETCARTGFFCYSPDSEAGCVQSTNSWYLLDCGGYCRSRGYQGSYGCNERVGCTCRGTILISGKSYACGSLGTNCAGNVLCCAGLSCAWHYNGGDDYYSCDSRQPPNVACSNCLAACRGLPGCCTGTGCLCDDEC